MGNTSPDNITYPDLVEIVGGIQGDLAVMAASIQTALSGMRTEFTTEIDDFFDLPVPVTQEGPSTQAIGATTWTAVPNFSPITIDLVRQAYVLVTLGAWMVSTSGDLRAGVAVSGVTTQAPSTPGWGQVMYVAGQGSGTVQNSIQKVVLCNAGVNTFTPMAYGGGGGSKSLNYATLQVSPLRWRREVL